MVAVLVDVLVEAGAWVAIDVLWAHGFIMGIEHRQWECVC